MTENSRRRGRAGVRIIAAFKLVKGILLGGAAAGVLALLHRDVAAVIRHAIALAGISQDNRYVQKAMAKLSGLTDHKIELLGLASFFYAALMLTEGIGLLLGKTWAEYLTVVATASFIPFEIYELALRPTVTRAVVLAVNVAVVGYLVAVLRQQRRA